MKDLAAAAVNTFVLTLAAACALRADDATLAVVAVAALIVLLTWFALLHSGATISGLGRSNPAAALALAVAGRQPWPTALPLITAHVVGAALGGLAALGLDGVLGAAQVGATPHWAGALVAGALVGLIGTWATFAIDGEAGAPYAAIPVLVGGAVLPVAFAALVNPATVLGIAAAGLLDWVPALIAAGSSLVGAVVGAYAMSVLLPGE